MIRITIIPQTLKIRALVYELCVRKSESSIPASGSTESLQWPAITEQDEK